MSHSINHSAVESQAGLLKYFLYQQVQPNFSFFIASTFLNLLFRNPSTLSLNFCFIYPFHTLFLITPPRLTSPKPAAGRAGNQSPVDCHLRLFVKLGTIKNRYEKGSVIITTVFMKNATIILLAQSMKYNNNIKLLKMTRINSKTRNFPL